MKWTSHQHLLRQPDSKSFYLHCTGGIRAAKSHQELWQIEPAQIEGNPAFAGFLSLQELQGLVSELKLVPIAYESSNWTGGRYKSNWHPILPQRKNHLVSPSDLWSNIASNQLSARISQVELPASGLGIQDIHMLVDEKGTAESTAYAIALSLRSLDHCIEKIADYYNEQLVNLTSLGKQHSQTIEISHDHFLFAQVHSFYLHLGSARDYLAAYVASKLGMSTTKIDSMKKLLDKLPGDILDAHPILNLLATNGYIVYGDPKDGKYKWEQSGWLSEATDLRNELVHRQPYGSKLSETLSKVIPLNTDVVQFRYFRSLRQKQGRETDLLDETTRHYLKCMDLFLCAAQVSEDNTSMPVITDEHVISINLSKQQ